MSEEEAACLCGYKGQYISDPAGPRLTCLSGVGPPELRADKWKEDAEFPHEGHLTREVFLLCVCLGLFVVLCRQLTSCFILSEIYKKYTAASIF